MTIAEKLKAQGCGGASCVQYILGRHVSTKLNGHTIGTCNPANEDYLYGWLREEGFRYEIGYNSYGVQHVNIYP